ncbi:hypothetical protein Gogos_011241 [Gossypium gossypioides]|uniref:Uncharacterized protein n=1 Tax=Gossypium gossypioides TaxID=34282 RepID=A0A7J9BNZ2_GOSGO|nr:hypothetical protein [Gossypium gossypioides]
MNWIISLFTIALADWTFILNVLCLHLILPGII